MSDPVEILRCPFCGGEANLEQVDTFHWAVYCQATYCGCCTPLCSSPVWALKY
jgi:hypothetical protein